MLRVDNKKEQIEIIGDSEQLKEEIGTLMLALCGETAKVSKGAAEDMYMSLTEAIARVALYLELKCGVRIGKKLREEVEKAKDDVKKSDDEVREALKKLEDALKKKGDE